MESLKRSERLYDPVRRRFVRATPEEEVRQAWIAKMVGTLGFPLSLLAVEKELKHLPHLKLLPAQQIPKRRIDIVAFAQGIHPEHALFPLLMVECKAVSLTPAFAQQVVGYNAAVQAPFVAVANGETIQTGSYDAEAGLFRFQEGLPSYKDLLHQVK